MDKVSLTTQFQVADIMSYLSDSTMKAKQAYHLKSLYVRSNFNARKPKRNNLKTTRITFMDGNSEEAKQLSLVDKDPGCLHKSHHQQEFAPTIFSSKF